jgi:ABC-2 type transport system ATP-binding protein
VKIQATHISVEKSKKKILDNFSIEIDESRIVGLIGPSGSGKTTLIRTLVGSQRITNGNITTLGHAPGSKEVRSRIGYMAQKSAFYSDITVSENLHYFASILGVSRNRVSEILELTSLSKHSGSLANTLSGGESSRLSLGIALLGNPDILFLDEPTVGLDPILRIELWKLFLELRQQGKLIFISSHILEEAERCDEVILMRDGKLLFFGEPSELKKKTGSADIEGSFIQLVSENLK